MARVFWSGQRKYKPVSSHLYICSLVRHLRLMILWKWILKSFSSSNFFSADSFSRQIINYLTPKRFFHFSSHPSLATRFFSSCFFLSNLFFLIRYRTSELFLLKLGQTAVSLSVFSHKTRRKQHRLPPQIYTSSMFDDFWSPSLTLDHLHEKDTSFQFHADSSSNR